MIEAVDIAKGFGGRTLFSDSSFTVAEGEKIGVWGLNGSGKSTLFKLILGEEELDCGAIHVSRGYKIGYISQYIKFDAKTVLDEAAWLMPIVEGGVKELFLAKSMLQGLGFVEEDFEKSPLLLSGGQQVRLQLAKMLLSDPNLLLLDEPSNYLDILSLRWLTKFLQNWSKELLLITHDRNFMDDIVTHILGIHRKQIRKMKGKVVDFEQNIYESEKIYEQTRINQERKNAQIERFIERFRYKSSKAKAVQSKIKGLEKLGKLTQLEKISELDFKFLEEPLEGKNAVTVTNISFGYDKENLLFNNLSFNVSSKDRIGIIGKNGKGKTTLLKMLAGELKPLNGNITYVPKAKIGYFGQTNVERLHTEWTIEDEIFEANIKNTRSRVRGICGLMMFSGDDALKKIKLLSGGEKSRVLLGRILACPTNILLLDEPTNHLDVDSTDALIDAAEEFSGAVLVVTHSEMVLRRLANKLIVFDNDACLVFNGNYDSFLETVGWSEEKKTVQEKNASCIVNKKLQRKARADALSQRNKVLKPLQQRVQEIEKSIEADEQKLKDCEQELVNVYQDKFSDQALKLTQTIQQIKRQIDVLFDELEKASLILAEAEKNYQ